MKSVGRHILYLERFHFQLWNVMNAVQAFLWAGCSTSCCGSRGTDCFMMLFVAVLFQWTGCEKATEGSWACPAEDRFEWEAVETGQSRVWPGLCRSLRHQSQSGLCRRTNLSGGAEEQGKRTTCPVQIYRWGYSMNKCVAWIQKY